MSASERGVPSSQRANKSILDAYNDRTSAPQMPMRVKRADRVDRVDSLLSWNRNWASACVSSDPDYFNRLSNQQAPEYLWIGCSDSRVPANVIVGLEPGEVFVQRNVGNQCMHTDMNVMSCLEYAVTVLKVKVIICCGHYGCGAVKGALTMPSKAPGLVNLWISDIRECRNQHCDELSELPLNDQIDRLCELNVMRQTFHVCTSPVVQNAWDQGQELSVYGMVYSLKDGLLRKLIGPLTNDNHFESDMEYERRIAQSQGGLLPTALNKSPISQFEKIQIEESLGLAYLTTVQEHDQTTADMASKVAQHVAWSEGGLSRRVSDINMPYLKVPVNFSPTRSPKISASGASPDESPNTLPARDVSPKRNTDGYDDVSFKGNIRHYQTIDSSV